MRIHTPQDFTLQSTDENTLHFSGGRGERLRLDVLDHDLIRVQHCPDGTPRLNRTWLVSGDGGDTPREGRSRDDLSPFPCPAFTSETNDENITLTTDKLKLRIHTGDFHITWADADGRDFAADLPRRAYNYDLADGSVYHYLRRREDEHYFGFGERAGKLDKYGRRLRMLNMDALSYNAESGDPLYKHFPFYITYLPEEDIAYGLFYDNLATTIFDMGSEIAAFWGFYRYYQALGGDLDYYLIYGPTIPDVIEKYTRLIGRPALPPRWTLGYLGSTMSYTDAPDADQQLRRFVALCDEHDIPCDLFHLSSGYTTNATGSRFVFTWNRDKIPDPAAMVRGFTDAGIRLAANIKPYLLKDHPYYDEVAAAGGFVKSPDDDAPQPSTFWSGGAFEAGDGAYIDFTSEAGYDWWKAQVKDKLLKYGIEAPWNDNNEYEIWDDDARCDGFGESLPIGIARPLQTLLMGRASWEAVRETWPERRPFILSRSGCPGIQRYAQTWSGDNDTSWHSMRFNTPMGLGMSLSGAPNTGHDVGGFGGPAPEPELFLRWVQLGIFYPRFTIHSWNTDGTVNEPWMYPEMLPAIRAAIRMRYRLLPYLYTLFVEASRTGQPIMRPLVYHFRDDARCRTESFDFTLGPNLLVAPVYEARARVRAVYLPGGQDWYDFYTGEVHPGGTTINAAAPLDRIPLFAPEGALIPTGREMRYVGQVADDVRRVYAFPHRESGRATFDLIEDDGVTMAYQRGGFTTVTLKMDAEPDALTFSVSARGDYPLAYDSVEFVLPAGETRSITGGTVQQGEGGARVVVAPVRS